MKFGFIDILISKYCLVVFILTFLASFFLIPWHVFISVYFPLAIAFMISFSMTLTCIIRIVKERINNARSYSSSIIGLIASVVGLSTLQVCGVGAPFCGATLGMAVVSIFFPNVALNIMDSYAIFFIIFSIVIQIIALYFMKCLFVCDKANSNYF